MAASKRIKAEQSDDEDFSDTNAGFFKEPQRKRTRAARVKKENQLPTPVTTVKNSEEDDLGTDDLSVESSDEASDSSYAESEEADSDASSVVEVGVKKFEQPDESDEDIPIRSHKGKAPERIASEEKDDKDSADGNDRGSLKNKGKGKAGTSTKSRSKRTKVESDEEDVGEIAQEELEDLLDEEENGSSSSAKKATKPKTKRAAKAKKPAGPKLTVRGRMERDLYENHPHLKTIFEDLEARPKIKPVQVDQPDGMTVTLLPFQKEGLHWLQKQEQSIYNGGILADEMGMGKTIQTVALLMTDTPEYTEGMPTLVVAPTVAIMQWKNEISAHTNDGLKVLVFYGQNRPKSVLGYDVVLTTYAVVESCYRAQVSGLTRKGRKVKIPSPLHQTHFHRIILDEAHNIKARQANTTIAICLLNSTYRLCLSGTPLQNRIGEIYSLLRFLKVEPFAQYFCRKCDCKSFQWKFTNRRTCDDCGHTPMMHSNFFNFSLLKHIQNFDANGSGNLAMNRLRLLLEQIMLRRTKLERADDLGLPPRVVEIRRDYFNDEEKDLYASIYSNSSRKFNTYVNQGVVLNNYANIFTLITRMRQIADHPDLVLRRRDASGENMSSMVCQICDDEAEEAIRSRCHHTFCRMCITEYCEGWTGDESQLKCPVCYVPLAIDLTGPALEMDAEEVKKGSIVNRINMTGGWRSSTKIEALVEELFKLRSDRVTIKSIVFSQFTSMLDLVEWRLRRAGFNTVKLQGSMSPTQRDSIIKHFMDTPSVEVFLVSLKAGGVALNLCEASQVFILDPWWNPAVEWQSGDRVHRIGQHRPIKITRLCIEDSIESRIIELQELKANMVHATIESDDGALNRLTASDMQFLFMN